MSRRLTRVNELLKREIGAALYRVIDVEGFDMAAITVTHVLTAPNLRNARVLVSVRDHEGQKQEMLNLLRKHRANIQKLVSSNVVLKYTPRLSFSLDTSLEQGDKTLSILDELDEDNEIEGIESDDLTTP